MKNQWEALKKQWKMKNEQNNKWKWLKTIDKTMKHNQETLNNSKMMEQMKKWTILKNIEKQWNIVKTQ